MREIKFRGKRLDNGEWLYGNLIELRNPFNQADSPVCFIMPKEVNIAEPDSIAEQEVVDPATVGQFTGLLDKHGEEIYEGDVVRTLSGFVGYMRYNERFIRFEVAAPHESYDNERNPDGVPRESWEVIGNIHDNPELLNQ